jgi:hypothetical protein
MSHDLDAGLRAGFAALREAEPRRDPAAVVAAANARRRRRRRSRRLRPALALVTATAAATVGVLAVRPAPDHARPSLAAVLHAAAAVAADRPPLAPTEGYRYVRELSRQTYHLRRDGREATVTVEQTSESWENAALDGQTDLGPSRITQRSGDRALATALAARLKPQLGGSHRLSADVARGALGPVPRLSELPEDPDGLLAALEDTVRQRSHWAPGLPTDAMVRFEVVGQATRLLRSATAPPRLRAAAFLMLARIPGARALGRKMDPQGRMGEAIAITLRNDSSWPTSDAPWPASVEREIIFDPDTSEVLALSGRSLGSREDTGDAAANTVVQAAGQVPKLGERP